MQENDSQAIWQRWQVYPEARKASILEEFRRKRPGDHYNKELLLDFLREKIARQERSLL